MGIRDMRDAFNEVASPTATCIKALMEYERSGGAEWQVMFFSGNYDDGTGFAIKSEKVRPSGDLLAASRETAQALLQQKRAT